jgi:hypothetical protein
VTQRDAVPRQSRRLRARLAVLVLGAGLALAGCTTGGSGGGDVKPPGPPSPPGPASPVPPEAPPSPAPSSTSAGECDVLDLTASGGAWSGAAGSRWADVTVRGSGPDACTLPDVPGLAMIDADGAVLAQSEPPGMNVGPMLEPGASVGITVQFSNTCDGPLALPLELVLLLGTDTIPVDGAEVSSEDDLPPCNAPGDPPALAVSGWPTP